MISVIIPVYNVEPYLERCVRSILNNTYKNLEIICINDGSTDQSLTILRHLAAEDRRIKIIDQKNAGVQTARNIGLENTSGEYIAFIDSDDQIHSLYFESLLECMEKHNADITVCGCERILENDKPDIRQYDEIRFHRLSDKQFFNNYFVRHMSTGRLYRRECIKKIRFSPEIRFAEDTLFNLRVVSEIESPVIFETTSPFYYYIQREGSLVTKASSSGYIDIPNWVVEHHTENDRNKWSWMLLVHAIKLCLSYRYEVWIEKDTAKIQHANHVLDVLISRMLKNRQISIKDKTIYLIMKRLPQIYRHYRIKKDPSLKKWEKNVQTRIEQNE